MFELGIMPETTRELGLVSGQTSPMFARNSENITKLERLGNILEKEVASHNISQVASCTFWVLGCSIQFPDYPINLALKVFFNISR